MNIIQNSLSLLNDFFSRHQVDFWLEAGTALAAFRDGKVFPWEHDIDIAIWRETMPEPESFIEFFEEHGYQVVFQRDYPYIDNIVQLKIKKGFEDKLFDIDIYLYSRQDGHAYMRWIHKPEGRLGGLKKYLLTVMKCLINPKSRKWKTLSMFFPKGVVRAAFFSFLSSHIKHSRCIYHRFPEEYFLNHSKIEFYGVEVNLPADTDGFLAHRYGSNWRTPDSEFNQAGKWKKAQARVELDMSLLPVPEFDERVVFYSE